jgi:hypothetical protein
MSRHILSCQQLTVISALVLFTFLLSDIADTDPARLTIRTWRLIAKARASESRLLVSHPFTPEPISCCND